MLDLDECWGPSFAEIIQRPLIRLGALNCAQLAAKKSDNNSIETLLNAF